MPGSPLGSRSSTPAPSDAGLGNSSGRSGRGDDDASSMTNDGDSATGDDDVDDVDSEDEREQLSHREPTPQR